MNQEQEAESVWDAIEALPAECREALFLSRVGRCETSEIARHLGVDELVAADRVCESEEALSRFRPEVLASWEASATLHTTERRERIDFIKIIIRLADARRDRLADAIEESRIEERIDSPADQGRC